jgi:23S rRNA (cytosine1962-C5)-methyltransferase
MTPEEKLPCLRHEDEDLLVLEKPAGVTTHRVDEHAQDGFYEWAQKRGPAWRELGLHHRLDKETSGLLVFSKTARGAKTLADQMESRRLEKSYLLYCAHAERPRELECDDRVAKARQGVRKLDPKGAEAVTEFTVLERRGDLDLVEARPKTGRTHQVRLHAQRLGMSILGDRLYGGAPAARLFLHAHRLELGRVSGEPLRVEAPLPPSWEIAARERPTSARVAVACALDARRLLFDSARTNAYRWICGHADGLSGEARVERLGDAALVIRHESAGELPRELVAALEASGARAVVERHRPKNPRSKEERDAAALRVLAGKLESPKFPVLEEGLVYLVDLEASVTSTGLFLDQRESRRRLASSDLKAKSLLNAFAHAGAFSVAAAAGGAITTSLDLSKRYLDWARENLSANGFDPKAHDFIYGDALDWLRRLGKKGRRWDVVVLDPPSFSTTKRGKSWSVERDLAALVQLGLGCLAPRGTLFVSSNQRGSTAGRFLEGIRQGLAAAGRRAADTEFATLPLDFRSGKGDPPYLKSVWVRMDD